MEKKFALELASLVGTKARVQGFPLAVAVVDERGACIALHGQEHVESEHVQRAITRAMDMMLQAVRDPAARLLETLDLRQLGAIAVSGENEATCGALLDEAFALFIRKAVPAVVVRDEKES